MYESKTLGERIKETRKKKNMKQSDLALKANISRVSVGNYERNERTPNADILFRIATALEVSISELMGIDDETIEEMTQYFLENSDRFLYMEKLDDAIEEYENNKFSALRNNNLLLVLFLRNTGYENALNLSLETVEKAVEILGRYSSDFIDYVLGISEDDGDVGSIEDKNSTNTSYLFKFLSYTDVLNKGGKYKALEYLKDLSQIKDYSKQNSSDDTIQ